MVTAQLTKQDTLRAEIRRLIRDVHADATTETLAAAKRLGVRMIQFTQPYGMGNSSRETGENAVRRDVARVAFPVQPGFLDALRPRPADLSPVRAVFAAVADQTKPLEIDWRMLDTTGSTLPAAHLAARGARGRVHQGKGSSKSATRWSEPKRIAVHADALAAYQKSAIEKVGKAKGGWATALLALSGTRSGIPKWVQAHIAKSPGRAERRITDSLISVLLQSLVTYAGASNVLPAGTRAAAETAALRQLLRELKKKVAAIDRVM